MPDSTTWDEESIKALIDNPTAMGITGIPAIQEYRPYTLSGHTACWKAAKLEMWDEVSQLLTLGADPNAIDEYDFTMMMWAAKNGNLDIVMQILDTGKVDIDAMTHYGFTAYMFAKKYEHTEIVQQLLMRGAMVKTPNPWDDNCPPRYHWKSRGGSHRRHPPPVVPVEADLMVNSTNDMNRYGPDGCPLAVAPADSDRTKPSIQGPTPPRPPPKPYPPPKDQPAVQVA